jgi:hypothetical protein
MKLLRHPKLLAISGALTVAGAVTVTGLGATAPPAHALSFRPPPAAISLSPAGPLCPTLTVSGGGFIDNATIEIRLYSNGPSGSGEQDRLTTSDSNGTISPVTFPNNTTPYENWQAEARQSFGSLVWTTLSNTVLCAP